MSKPQPAAHSEKRQWWRPSGRSAGATVLLLLLLTVVAAHFGATPAHPGLSAVTAATGGCSGAPVPGSYFGAVVDVGAPTSPPSVANVSVRISYQYQILYAPNGGPNTTSCPTTTGTSTTNGSGGFTLSAGVPTSSCDRVSCTYYTGPFGPVSFTDPNPPPAGYFVRSSEQGSRVTISLVAALSSVALSPWGRATLSVLAPTSILANATAGNGAPSPAALTYDWRLSGSGWSVLQGSGSANLTVEAQTGSGLGSLELWTNGTYGGGTFHLLPVTLQLIAVATNSTSSDVSPTSLDAGAPATFTLHGTGSAGYSYSATIVPGLGSSSVTTPCTAESTMGGTVALTCVALVTYSTAGVAQPSANLTNRFSTADHQFPQIQVAPKLGITLSPDPTVVYASAMVDFGVAVATNSGTSPYGPACLWTGNGALNCSSAPGPSWSFGVAYPVAGTYTVRATVSDAAGSNSTASVTAQVFERPSLSPIVPSTNSVNFGQVVNANALFSGGAMDGAFWWNDSLPNGTLSSGVVDQDGTLSGAFSLVTPGPHQITLTVKDALGTTVAQSFSVIVKAGPATAIVPNGGPLPVSVSAGTPWISSWAAVDARGVRVIDSPPSVQVSIASGSGEAVWVNGSDGPHRLFPNQPVNLSASAWQLGFLNLSVTSLISGPLKLQFRADVAFATPNPGFLTISIAPDLGQLVLGDPVVAHASARSNDTLWQIADRFGNPAVGGYVVVRMAFGSTVTNSDSPIRSDGNRSTVWVNYSAPVDSAGTIYVLSESNQELLAPLRVPAATSSDLTT
ncbi:MAG: PKD domain-containing protein, partial [Thermoplasmata archaeon]|nr:PKD domain-containing protein [Thermoplasmata archaeon]